MKCPVSSFNSLYKAIYFLLQIIKYMTQISQYKNFFGINFATADIQVSGKGAIMSTTYIKISFTQSKMNIVNIQ